MEKYKALDGRTEILEYENGEDYIIIKFCDGAERKYTYDSTGLLNVELMKNLAWKGYNLAEYTEKYAFCQYEKGARDEAGQHPRYRKFW